MRSKHCKHIVDILLGIGLLMLMSYQVTGEAWHEWTGIVMTMLMILHQILNRKWYAALFRGKYTPLRTVQTLVNAVLVISFVLTALCGINMSVHAVPFRSEFMRASLGRRLHLTLSHWCFVLMGLHLGLHIPAMLKSIKSSNVRRIGFGCSVLAAGVGLWLFLKNSYPDYLFCRVPFAFIDYDKAVPLVLLEALLIAFFWIFIGAQLPTLLNRRADTNRKLISLIGILLAVVLGMGLTFVFPAGNEDSWNEEATPWGTVVNEENACRAGTTTPFNTIHATGPEKANYYGHYPYEIEENYFDDSALETRPGRYRQTTVAYFSASGVTAKLADWAKQWL